MARINFREWQKEVLLQSPLHYLMAFHLLQIQTDAYGTVAWL